MKRLLTILFSVYGTLGFGTESGDEDECAL